MCRRDGNPWRCGDDATRALTGLIAGEQVRCTERDVDRYHRTVATCDIDGEDIGATMVWYGWALDYDSHGAYADEQLDAEQAQRGAMVRIVRAAVGVAAIGAMTGAAVLGLAPQWTR